MDNIKDEYTLTKKQEEAFDLLMKGGGDSGWVSAEAIGLIYALEALEKVGVVQIAEKNGKIYVAQAGITMEALEESEEKDGKEEWTEGSWVGLLAGVSGVGKATAEGILADIRAKGIKTPQELLNIDLTTLEGVGASTARDLMDHLEKELNGKARSITESPDTVQSKLKQLRKLQRKKKLKEMDS